MTYEHYKLLKCIETVILTAPFRLLLDTHMQTPLPCIILLCRNIYRPPLNYVNNVLQSIIRDTLEQVSTSVNVSI